MIYHKTEYFSFDSDLGHKIVFFNLALYGSYMVAFLAKLVKPFRIYRKMKYLTLTFDLYDL